MSLLPLTATVMAALRTDFQRGQWSPVTQQFFQQLFDRVGGATAPTTGEIQAALRTMTLQLAQVTADLHLLQTRVAALSLDVEALSALVAALPQDLSLAPLSPEIAWPVTLGEVGPREAAVLMPDFGLGGPREAAVLMPDFGLGGVPWP